jgi:hypothetical protein
MPEPESDITDFIYAANDDNEKAHKALYRIAKFSFTAQSVIDPRVG